MVEGQLDGGRRGVQGGVESECARRCARARPLQQMGEGIHGDSLS